VPDAAWQEVLGEVDGDGNGDISFEEFKVMMRNLMRA